jgi:hypothetical protein
MTLDAADSMDVAAMWLQQRGCHSHVGDGSLAMARWRWLAGDGLLA